MLSEEQQNELNAHVGATARHDGLMEASALCEFLDDEGFEGTFEDFAAVGNLVVASWNEGFMSKFIPYVAGKIKSQN